MNYETEFRLKEKEFRPRDSFKHEQVVNSLANIVRDADNELEELSDIYNEELHTKSLIENSLRKSIGLNVILSGIIGVYCVIQAVKFF